MESTTTRLTLSPLTLHQTRGGPIRLKYGVIITTIYLIFFFSKVKAWSCPSCFTPLQAIDAPLRLQASTLIDSASSNDEYTGSIRQLCCVTISLAQSPPQHTHRYMLCGKIGHGRLHSLHSQMHLLHTADALKKRWEIASQSICYECTSLLTATTWFKYSFKHWCI